MHFIQFYCCFFKWFYDSLLHAFCIFQVYVSDCDCKFATRAEKVTDTEHISTKTFISNIKYLIKSSWEDLFFCGFWWLDMKSPLKQCWSGIGNPSKSVPGSDWSSPVLVQTSRIKVSWVTGKKSGRPNPDHSHPAKTLGPWKKPLRQHVPDTFGGDAALTS